MGGNFTVVVTDSEGCRDTAMFSIPAYDYVVPDITTDSLSICPGQETTVLSAERPDVVSYQWLPTQQTTPEITVGIAGQYTVEVVFTNGCTATNSVQITNDSIPNAAITGDDKICPGALSALSAPSGLGYVWSGNAGSTQSVSVPPGTYTLTVTNGYGCTNTGSFSVAQLAPPVATLTSDKEKICKPETALLMVTTNAPVVSYDWNIPGASGTQYVIADSSTVTVVVTDSEGCRDTVTLFIPAYDYEEPKITGKTRHLPGSGNNDAKCRQPECSRLPMVADATNDSGHHCGNRRAIHRRSGVRQWLHRDQFRSGRGAQSAATGHTRPAKHL
jgi:hypothetical protein